MVWLSDRDDAEREVFTVQKGVLRANTDMYWEYLEDFEVACRKLLDTRRSRVVVDLTQVNFISSSFLGCLSTTMLGAARRKKRLCLRMTLDVSWLFDIMGAGKNVEMEVY